MANYATQKITVSKNGVTVTVETPLAGNRENHEVKKYITELSEAAIDQAEAVLANYMREKVQDDGC